MKQQELKQREIIREESSQNKYIIRKPNYYDEFHCTASDCSMTCCQEWKIAVDDETYDNWKQKGIPDVTVWKDDSRVIGLNEAHICPFLSENRLCNLVTLHGEKILSHTCHVFPRETHYGENVTECTLMPSCPEVVDIMNRQTSFKILDAQEVSLSNGRSAYIAIANQEALSMNTALLMIFYLALEGVEELQGQELLLDELRQTIDKMEFNTFDTFEERNELFLDLIDNYRKEEMYRNQLMAIAELAESYSVEYDEDELLTKLEQYSAERAKFDRLLKILLAEEIYAELYCSEENGILDFEDYELDLSEFCLVKLQWLAMELAVIEQCMYLTWELNGALTYEMVRSMIVVVFRMTGYDDEDIIEYLENSFESLIWDWGYLAMIIGK